MIPVFPLIIILLFSQANADCYQNYEFTDSNSGLCQPCEYNCLTCYDAGYCLECMSEHYLSNNTCIKCSFGCAVCTSNSSCTTCNSGLYLTNSGTCSACGTGIATCTIAVIQSCQTTYFLLSTICAGCFTNCNTCVDFVTCSACALGYYLGPTSTSCLACPANCLICTDSTTCTACQRGYTQSGGLCSPFDCASFDPFCLSCTNSQCLTCQQGKYLNSGNTCSQGASLLCLEATGLYHTACDTSGFGCPTYAYVQTDINGNQLPVCLPKSATKTEEFIYLQNTGYTCSGSCSQSSTSQLSYLTSQAYYSVNYYLTIRFFGTTASRPLTIVFLAQNKTPAVAVSKTVDISKEIGAFSDTDSNCLGCKYSQTIVSGVVSLSQGGFETVVNISDSSGMIQIMEALFQHGTCQVSYCSSCTSAIDCYACFPPYILQLTSCVTSCDSGFYFYSQVCYLQCPVGTFTLSSTYSCSTCQSPCLTCSDVVSCLTCVSGYYLEGSSCRNSCSSTYLFANATSGHCETCPNPCVTCDYTNSVIKCLSCAAGYLFNGSSCVFLCPWGEYGSFLNGTSACLSCTSECSSCYINNTVCSSCTSGYLLLNTDCLSMTSCPSAYFINSTYNQCVSCHFPCATCSLGPTQCTSCLRGSLYANSCWNKCPSGMYSTYANPQNISCTVCISPCQNCISSTQCSSCVSGYFLYQATCLLVCPSGFYANSLTLTCAQCVPPCKSCSNSSACLSCTTGYLDNTTCTLQCNTSAYVSANFSCTLCPTPCLACYASDYCLTCQLPYFLFDNGCITLVECNNKAGYYPSYLPNASIPTYAVCSLCTFPCLACINNSITCTTCQNGYYYVPNLYKCVTTCPSTYYTTATSCLLCSSNCYQCSISSNNCTSCSAGMYLNGSVCVSACGNGYYADDQTQSCSLCSSPCLTCYNLYLCSSCQTGILYEKQCISTCPSQTFLNTTSNTCITCTNNCLTCVNSSSLCLNCVSGYFLLNQTCISTCPSLYYGNEFSRVCQECSSPCGNCTTATSCLTCISSYYFFNTLCVSSCSSSYYADNATNQCLSCNMTICLTCTGTSNSCLTCNTNNGYFMYQQQCVSSCLNGTYADQIGGNCGLCPFPCSTCLNYTFCTSCLSSYLLFANRCFSQCPIAYYADNSSSCQPCASDCQVCSSTTFCLECKSGFYIMNGTCVVSCPLSYYKGLASITNYDSCQPCQINCLNCSSEEYCLVCSSGFMQFNGLCLTSCPILYYADNTSSSTVCNQCSQYCTSCVNSTYCLNCIGSYLYQHACIIACPTKTYPYQGTTCNPCKSPCDNCTGDYTCTSCLTPYIYFHEYCVTKCPSDVWYYPNNNTCNANCPYNKYAEKMECYVGRCGVSMVTLNGYCLQQCTSNYYVNQDQECTLCTQNPSQCTNLFTADLEILYVDVLTLVLYYNQRAEIANIADISVSFVDVNGNIIPKTYSSYEISQYKIVIKYDYSSVSLVNVTLSIPYVQSQEYPQCIATNQFKQELQIYRDYSNQSRPSWLPMLPMLLIGLLFVVIVINMINRASHFVQLLDFVQIVGVTLYLNVQYPPILEDFLSGFRIALFVFSENLVNLVPYSFSPPKFIFYNVDASVFRNSLLLLIVFLAVLVLFLIVISVNAFKKDWFVKAVRVIRYRLLNDLFSICLTPLLLFACQILHETPAAIFITTLLGIAGIGYVVWISYKIIKVRKLSELQGLLGEFQKTESKLGLMYIPFGYVRRITLTLGLGLAPISPISTLTLLLVCTFLIMICVYFYEPFDNHFTDYVTIFMECSLTLYVVCLVILALKTLPASSAFGLGSFVVALVALTFILCLSWLIYLTVSDIRTKGCWPSLKEQVEDKQGDDYSDSKSQKMRKKQEREKEDEKRKNLGIQEPLRTSQPVNGQHAPNEESANQILNRFQSRTDQLFSNAPNQEFKHWSDEQGSRASEEHREEGRERLPNLLMKKQIGGTSG